MSPNPLFSVANLIALAAWLMLAILPRRPVTAIVTRTAVPILFAMGYTAILATTFRGSEGGFSSIADVQLLFSNPWALLAGWIHYLTFDLLVGTWEVRDAQERGIPHLLVVPCLILTFLFGPAGWLLYCAVRNVRRRGP